MSKVLMLTSTLLMIGKALSFYNKSYDGYTFILPDIEKYPYNSLPTRLSFADAQQWCKKTVAGSTLAAIYNKDIQRNVVQFIRRFLQDKSRQRVTDPFINIRLNGKYNMTDDWRWVNGHPKAADLTVHNSTVESFEFYARVKNLSIYSTTRAKKGRFICEYPVGIFNQCSALLNERCYKIYIKSLTWYDARNNCSGGGGDLASFESLSDANINNLLRNLSLDSNIFYWIGLQKNEWQWVDTDSPIKYSNWAINRPSNYSLHCLCITPSEWDWKECDCSRPHPFICILNDTRDSPAPTPLNDISATAKLVVIIVCCAVIIAIILVIISVAASITKKRRNSDAPRAVKSSAYENVNEYSVTHAIKDFPAYTEVQEPNATNSASNTTYAKVEMAENTYVEHPVNGIVYAELDLAPRP